jgi:hypothetical protein
VSAPPPGRVEDDDFEWPLLEDAEVRSLCAAVAALHRQAHPGEHPDVAMCHQEPCRSLALDVLREVTA